ncbi:hypothetical protein GUITHDRAFT_116885 [Guillardia theta CCMP2712]|uniref:protein-serine/threonine phosphatase n=1 Tax=Guillardia theta (strain CCMP2712) TaxID=905079 RepID=L1IL72_GUITC|nr:hypothetical protein GUITHDRAFT_116885 [Guillardia theta CCMP2712]EKX36862.1 hypothetical protein GUITHDRAFT_116885 [Guillardia theta CCMP2712]|eukprot:XP_005823842.1 hypothetical protein GUITHDRAFT_116885 [Guillardia theta CCMP2712]
MSKSNVAFDTLMRAREEARRAESEQRIAARELRIKLQAESERKMKESLERDQTILTRRTQAHIEKEREDNQRIVERLTNRYARVMKQDPRGAGEIRVSRREESKESMQETDRVKRMIEKRLQPAVEKKSNAQLAAEYRKRAEAKAKLRKEEEEAARAAEEEAFLDRIRNFELFPAPSHRPRSRSPSSRTPATLQGGQSAKSSQSARSVTNVSETESEAAERQQHEHDVWQFSHTVREAMINAKLPVLNLRGMLWAGDSFIGRAYKNLDRIQMNCPLMMDASSALFLLADGHHSIRACEHVCNQMAACIGKRTTRIGKNISKETVEALKQGILDCDDMYTKDPTSPRTLYCANLGSNRAVLCSGTDAEDLSRDHVVWNPLEKKRISYTRAEIRDNQLTFFDEETRKEFTAPVTRGIGEHELTRKDRFLVVASRGLWSVMSSQEVVDQVREMLIEIIFDDVAELGLRDLYEKKAKTASYSQKLKDINLRRGDLTPSHHHEQGIDALD